MNNSDIIRKYQFVRINKAMGFCSNGQIGLLFNNSQLKVDTLAKMAEGLNHFLEYYYHNDNDIYEEIGHYMFMKILYINQDIKNHLVDNIENYKINREYLISKYIAIDDHIIEYICRYVKACSKIDIDESEATTEITLRNTDCAIIHTLSVFIKLAYVLLNQIRGDKKFEEILAEHIDTIIYKIIKASEHYFEYPDGFDIDIEHNHIVNFMYELYRRDWNKQNNSFQIKFEEVGRDVVKLSLSSMVRVFSSLRKYVPSLIDMNNPKYKTSEDVDTSTVYWTIDKDWTEFALVNKNLVGYIRTTTMKIMKRQDAKATLANINLPDFMQDVSSDDSFVHKEHALYYDKKKFMYEACKSTTIKVFEEALKALKTLDKEKSIDVSILGLFSLSKDHALNQFILTKILLALTGDSRIYLDQLGVFSKFILLLFYERVISSKELSFMHEVAQCMIMTPTISCMFDEKNVDETLKELNIGDVNLQEFFKIAPVYVREEYTIYPDLGVMLDFYSFMLNPSRIRNLLYPDKYEVEDLNAEEPRDRDANEYERPILEECMKEVENGFKTKL